MITDFGGQLGLWIGGSVVVLVEYITFFVLMILFGISKCLHCYHKKKKNNVEPREVRIGFGVQIIKKRCTFVRMKSLLNMNQKRQMFMTNKVVESHPLL